MIAANSKRKIYLFTAPDCNGLIRKLSSGEFRLYSRKRSGSTIVRKHIGTYCSLAIAKKFQQEL